MIKFKGSTNHGRKAAAGLEGNKELTIRNEQYQDSFRAPQPCRSMIRTNFELRTLAGAIF
jgi:hypothetical protein